MYYYLEESGIFLRLTAELAGNCALNVIFACVFVCVCVCVCIRGLLAAVHFLGVKVWVFHLGLAFLRSCFVSYIILYYHIFVWRVCLFVFFCFSFS